MNKKELIKRIQEFSLLYNTDKANIGKAIVHLESDLKSYLNNHPDDVEIWLRIIGLEFFPEMQDPALFSEYFNKLLALERKPIFYVLKALAELLTSYISPQTYRELCSISITTDEDRALVAYMKALFIGPSNKDYESLLLESVTYGNTFVWNHIKLANFYACNNQPYKENEYIKKAFLNVKVIYNNDFFIDPTDFNEIINEEVKGIHLTHINFNNILNRLRQIQ